MCQMHMAEVMMAKGKNVPITLNQCQFHKIQRKISALQRLWHAGKRLDFGCPVFNGSHHIYVHADVSELVNLQNVNGQAKLYQVKQLLCLIERYNLQMEEGP